MNICEQSILSYSNTKKQFGIDELTAHLNNSSNNFTKYKLYHCLNKLIDNKQLVRISRGKYSCTDKKDFIPVLNDETKKIYKKLIKAYPFANFCIYEGQSISSLQHHISVNNITYIETDRDAVESIFNFLIKQKLRTYLKPTKDLIYNYVNISEKAIFVKPLISEAPIQMPEEIPIPTIEKLLVDINKDSDFFYLQEGESRYIFETAFNLYNINQCRLLRYASRRGLREEMKKEIKLLAL